MDYIPEQTILYRQHDNNVTGAHRRINQEHYIRSIRNISRTISDQRAKLNSFRQLPFHVSLLKIVWLKFVKCMRTMLLKNP